MKLYCVYRDGVDAVYPRICISRVRVVQTKGANVSSRIVDYSLLLFQLVPRSNRPSFQTMHSERERERETSSVRPRIYISIPRDNARLLATYTRRISNDSFVSFQFIRDNLAHQFSKTCTAETWQTGEFIGPLPVVIYLRFVCPPAGKEISRSKYSVHAGGEDGEED